MFLVSAFCIVFFQSTPKNKIEGQKIKKNKIEVQPVIVFSVTEGHCCW